MLLDKTIHHHRFGVNYTPSAEPRGAIAGKSWAIDAPTVVGPGRPKILFCGDSISVT